jgi:hypothetical protein
MDLQRRRFMALFQKKRPPLHMKKPLCRKKTPLCRKKTPLCQMRLMLQGRKPPPPEAVRKTTNLQAKAMHMTGRLTMKRQAKILQARILPTWILPTWILPAWILPSTALQTKIRQTALPAGRPSRRAALIRRASRRH